MEAYREEALKAKQFAERRFAEKDFTGARSYALRARSLFPDLEGLSQMLTTYDSRHSTRRWLFCFIPTRTNALELVGLSRSYPKLGLSSRMISERLDTFWTVCTSCKVQYEYLRKYVNKRLSCKNCRGAFIAVETGPGPVSASVQYAPPAHTTSNGYGSHGYDFVSGMPANPTYFLGQYPAHGYEYDWNSYVGTSPGNLESNRMSSVSSGYPSKLANGVVLTKAPRPEKKRNVSLGSSGNGFVENTESKTTKLDGNKEPESKHVGQSHGKSRRWSAPATGLDTRKLLISKAKTNIQQRLEMMRLASVAAEAMATEDAAPLDEVKASSMVGDGVFGIGSHVSSGHQSVRKINGPITVPDSDFHDFDSNRSEECFEARQIWAIYDEDDGMPRLYCVVREVLSVQPFKIDIAYLSSKTDIEFGTMKWVQYGFTKSCGHFRIRNTDIVEHVNIFSHLLKDKKTGRGGCVRIFPKTGEIWAVYKNWSPDWNNSTPDEVRHQYEMVEILDEYSEQFGVCIASLVKVEGYKTVYCRREESTKWIPRKEMLRFSHQVPSWFLKEETSSVPGNCWDLDPAAIPEELLGTGAGTD
ncbi:BnaC04g29790D [Brassica napus]|uniref:BnaC04g29790D protein n=1 Tax=Brassica napus TaxID=3708 RepID=A0A078IDM6_BRANA|nr:BnaC04g29790D [Brassica napus]